MTDIETDPVKRMRAALVERWDHLEAGEVMKAAADAIRIASVASRVLDRLEEAEEESARLSLALSRIALGIEGRRESGLREGERGEFLPLTDWQLAEATLEGRYP